MAVWRCFAPSAAFEPQSETVWRQADRYHVPRIAFINKMDRVGADFDRVVDQIRTKLGSKPVPIQIPIGQEASFSGVVDLIEMKARVWEEGADDYGTTYTDTEIPGDLRERAQVEREKLFEAIADVDDTILDLFIEGENIESRVIRAALRKAVIQSGIVPVLCGSALKNKGVQMLLDAVIDYLPSPSDVPPVVGLNPDTNENEIREAKADQPFTALAFKVMSDPHGRLTYFRVYSGQLNVGSAVLNVSKGKKEKIGRLLRMHANKREETKHVTAGDIVCAPSLNFTTTGDTLSEIGHPILLETLSFPDPVIFVAIEPKTTADQDRLNTCLERMAMDDPTFHIKFDEETGQTVISGMGELHLEIIVDRIKREYGVKANVGKPQVAYRETIRKTAVAEEEYIRQHGGRGHYGHVKLTVGPLENGAGFRFTNRVNEECIPKEFITPIEQGIRESLLGGPLLGYPIVDVGVELTGGSFHQTDSSEMAYSIAASIAFRAVLEKADPVLLEPIMSIEIVCPDECMGDILGNLNSRRGRASGVERRGGSQVIDGTAPLSEMFGYATSLRSLSQGRATYTMELSHYEETPSAIQHQLITGMGIYSVPRE